ncbi:MAG: M4 family metallopeptidase [Chloroflexota bacterium]
MPRLVVKAARSGVVIVVLVVTLLAVALPASASPPARHRLGDDGWEARQIRKGGLLARDRKLLKGLPEWAKLGYHPETKRVRFLSGTPARPLTAGPPALASGRRKLSMADARSQARGFMNRYGRLFGLKAPGRELRVSSARKRLAAGAMPNGGPVSVAAAAAAPLAATVRFAQVRDGIPVLGGEIVVQVSAQGEIVSAVGEVLPSRAKAPTRPRLKVGRARSIAREWLAREAGRPARVVKVRSEGLGLFDPRIMGDPTQLRGGVRLVWQIDAQVPARAGKPADRRLVLVDAEADRVLTSIGRIHGTDRRVCDNRNVAGRSFRCNGPFARTEGQGSSGIADVDAVYRLMGVVDAYFRGRFGRDGIDGRGGRMKATVRYCPSFGCPWRNAEWHWAEQQAVFGRGWARADDIVAHEYTHGLLDAGAPLVYFYQSGALNESFADVFGELIDLSYSRGTDTAWTRWKIGEDTPVGIFRDMKDPTRFGHADRVRSPLWQNGKSDFGGVRRNSGVGNKAAFLIADGGTFRGRRIAGIGLARTARVYYQALTTRLTSASDYVDLADALVSACADLAGTNGITVGHCKTVRDATQVTQMSLSPKVRPPRDAPLCGNGKRPIDIFNDDLETPAGSPWQTVRLAGKKTGWYYPPNPNNNPRWDGTWASSGKLNFYAPNRGSRSDTVMKLKQAQQLPAGAFLRFEHGYGFDKDAKRRYDGGIVQVKLDGGPWRGVGALFTHGGYNGKIARNRGNPLAGRRAFTGNSRGWSAARVDLSNFAGKAMKLRFRMASDRSVGSFGWYIDDVRIYTCAADADRPSGTLSIDGGAASSSDTQVALAITASDASTWLTRLRVSNSGELNGAGTLLKGLSMSIRDGLVWDLSEPAWGGTPGLGTKRVYAQVRDAAGNWSAVFSDDIELVAAP